MPVLARKEGAMAPWRRTVVAGVVALTTHLGLPPAGHGQALVDPETVYVGSFQGWGTALA